MTNSALGKSVLTLGPGNLYFDTDSAGSNTYLGNFDSLILRAGVVKAPLVAAQTGTEPADQAVTGASVGMELGLAQATLERLELVQQGLTLNKTLEVINSYEFSSVLGERDSDIMKQAYFVEFDSGVESVNPLDIIDFWYLAPTTAAEWTYDAATQRFVKVGFIAYQRDDKLDAKGRPTYFRSRFQA